MSGRERVGLAFRHKEPDRTPWFEKLIKSPVTDWILGRTCLASNFEARMALLERGEWEELAEREAQDIADLVTFLEMDMVRLYTNVPKDDERPVRIGEGVWRQGEELVRLKPEWGALMREPVEPDLRSPEELERDHIAEIEAEYEPPEPFTDDRLFVFHRVREILRGRGIEPAIMVSVYTSGAATLPDYMWPWFHERPELMHRSYGKNARRGLDLISRWVKMDVDLIALGGDFACDHGPMISPAHYREFLMPGLRRQSDAVFEAGCFSSNASDGDLWPLLDEFLLGVNVDGYEEIDFAAGMDLARLKKRCGAGICFIGNIDCRHLLTSATPGEVQKATVECLEAGWGDGGHILMSSNCIHQGVRPQNFRAMVNAYRSYFGLDALSWPRSP